MLSPRDRLVVALDFPDRASALSMAGRLHGEVGMYKIGKELFTSEGSAMVREVAGLGEKIFLDLKFHDIPNTVAGAVAAAARLGVALVNVHALGGIRMMQAAAGAAAGTSTRVLAVTVLTSLDSEELAVLGFRDPADRLVVRLARLALEAGLGGVVAAPTEVALLRKELGAGFLIVTPGIRLPGTDLQDQARVATPDQAVRYGADYVVVGRPITQASDPVAAARKIVGMLSQGSAVPRPAATSLRTGSATRK